MLLTRSVHLGGGKSSILDTLIRFHVGSFQKSPTSYFYLLSFCGGFEFLRKCGDAGTENITGRGLFAYKSHYIFSLVIINQEIRAYVIDENALAIIGLSNIAPRSSWGIGSTFINHLH